MSDEIDFEQAKPKPVLNPGAQKVVDKFMAPGPEDVEKLTEVGPLEWVELCEPQLREYKQIIDKMRELELLKEKRREQLLHNMRGMESATKGKFSCWIKKRAGGTRWKEMFTAIAGEPKKEDLERFRGAESSIIEIKEIPA